MEDKSNKIRPTGESDWVECESKSRPGHRYLFNTATAECKWLTATTTPEKVTKSQMTPANDRLKRLQNQLQKTKTIIQKKEKKSTNAKPQKPTAAIKKSIPKSGLPLPAPKVRLKKLQGDIKKQLDIKNCELIGNKSVIPKQGNITKLEKTTAQTVPLVVKKQLPKRNVTETDKPKGPKLVEMKASAKMQKITNSHLKYVGKSPKDPLKVKDCIIPRIPKVDNTKNKTNRQNQESQPQKIVSKDPVLKMNAENKNIKCPPIKRLQPSASERLVRNRSLNCVPTTEELKRDKPKNNISPLHMQESNAIKKIKFKAPGNTFLTEPESINIPPTKRMKSNAANERLKSSLPRIPKLRETQIEPKSNQSSLQNHETESIKNIDSKVPSSTFLSQSQNITIPSTQRIKSSANENLEHIRSLPRIPVVGEKNINATNVKKDSHQQEKIKYIEFEVPDLKFLKEAQDGKVPPVKRMKCSANDRLECFRKSLQVRNETIFKNQIVDSGDNSHTSSSIEYEPMDWEPIEEPNTIWTGITNTNNNNDTCEEMDVDENLMLEAAEEICEMKQLADKWQRTSTYIVLDTNVFVHHLSFIEELRIKNIRDATGFVLYIPYSVLQELDNLKRRDSIKIPIMRAIKYLNKLFEEKNKSIQAQSALEENNHIINITSPDDSIINCCLQVKAEVLNIMLITQDVNLRNKAMSNDIPVSSVEEIQKKQHRILVEGIP